MTELKSLKNPQRILSVLMFIAVFIVAIGPEALGQALPFVPQTALVGIVAACAWAINQKQTENRVIRAEDLKENQIINNIDEYIDGDGA